MKPLHYEGAPTASHAIFYLFKMEKNILISNWIPKILFQFCYFRLLLGIEAEPL